MDIPSDDPTQPPIQGSAAEACVFCAIAAGAATASIVHQDEHIMAFLDILPVTPGHLLVIPRRHYVGLSDVPPDLAAEMFRVAHRLSALLRRSGLRCEGVNLFLADGEAAGQEVFHVHLHVFPRFEGDGFAIEARWESVERSDLDTIAATMRAAAEEI